MTTKRLSVRMHGQPVAELAQLDTGLMQLRYIEEAHRPLSLSLPVREAPYDQPICEAYFGGLLPEDDAARKRIAERHHISPRNTFELLRAIGLDCAGAVSLHEPSDPVIANNAWPIEAAPVSEAVLAKHIRDLPTSPLFMDVAGLRLSLAGVQSKAAVCLLNDQVAWPVHGTPTTHILKPAVDRFEALVFNEYLCLKLAKAIGLDVPTVEVREVEGIPYLLIERYDRRILPDGRISRIHQEDFCQALGVSSERKYESQGGPGLADCFGLTLKLQKPAPSRLDLLRRVVFNVLVGNSDAHGKNFSIMHGEAGKPTLAPVYDVVCTRYYQRVEMRMAMKLGGKELAEDLYARHWLQFSQDVKLGFPLVREVVPQVHAQLAAAIERECASAERSTFLPILACIEAHAALVARHFEMSLPFVKGR